MKMCFIHILCINDNVILSMIFNSDVDANGNDNVNFTLRVNKALLHKATVLRDQSDCNCGARFGTKMVWDKRVKRPDCFTISSPALVPRHWSCSKIPQTLSRLYCKICTGEEWHLGIVGITHRPSDISFYLDITMTMVIRIIFFAMHAV